MTTRDLPTLRDAIEAVDHELLHLLRRRMDLVEEVAAAKLEAASPFRDQLREDQILQRVRHFAVE
ncbi:MAG TPA: chorismate mutase, partial [Thermoanaerobaculia bacterium]|nr:chorismate mutase [Thermoanaerobaculia bacterium]